MEGWVALEVSKGYIQLAYWKRKASAHGFELPQKIILQGRRGFNSRANFTSDKKSRACRVVEAKKETTLVCGSKGLGKVIRMLRPVSAEGLAEVRENELQRFKVSPPRRLPSPPIKHPHAVFSLVGYDHSPCSFHVALCRLF